MFILSFSNSGRVYGVSSGDAGPDPWRSLGLCLDADPDLFFPDGEAGPAARAQIAEAKAVCAVCPVLVECREFELTPVANRLPRNAGYGVFAGMTAQERRAEVRRRERLREQAELAAQCAEAAGVASAAAGAAA